MLLVSYAPRLLLISILAASAERPSEGGGKLELDSSGHLSASEELDSSSSSESRTDATHGQQTTLLQMKAVLEDVVGKEAELRSALYHAVKSEAALEQRTLDASPYPQAEAAAGLFDGTHAGSLAEVSAEKQEAAFRAANALLELRMKLIDSDDITEFVEPGPPGAPGGQVVSGGQGVPGQSDANTGGDVVGTPVQPPPQQQQAQTGQPPPQNVQGPPQPAPQPAPDPTKCPQLQGGVGVVREGCESMCYRLFLTKMPFGTCNEVVNDLETCCKWSKPSDKRAMQSVKQTESWYQSRRPFDLPYVVLKDNCRNGDVDGYLQGLKEYLFQGGLQMSEQQKYSNVIEKIRLGIDVRHAVDDGLKAMEERLDENKATQQLTTMIEQATQSQFKYPAMEVGIATMKIIADQLRTKTNLKSALANAQQAISQFVEKSDQAYLDLNDAIGPANQVFNDKDDKQKLLLQQSKDFLEAFRKSLNTHFANDVERALNKYKDTPAKGLDELLKLIARMEKLDPACSDLVRDTRDKTDKAKTDLRKVYEELVDKAQQALVTDTELKDLKARSEELTPKIKMMKDLKLWDDVRVRAETISQQLDAWALLKPALERAEETLEDDKASEKAKQRCGIKLGIALDAAKCLPEEFDKEIDKAQDFCEMLEKEGGCPPPPTPAPAPEPAAPRAAAWRSTIPGLFAHLILICLVTLWPSS